MRELSLPGIAQPTTDPFSGAGRQLETTIRAAARVKPEDRPAAVKAAAREVESLFVCYLRTVMRETLEDAADGEGGFGKGIYTELFDQEVSRVIAQHGALGIAELITGRFQSPRPDATPSLPLEPSAMPGTQPPVRHAAPAEGPGAPVEDFQLPLCAPISSGFGNRTHPFSGRRQFHKGIDIAAPAGVEVPSVLAGEVVMAGYQRGYGNTVVVRHGNEFHTRYAHLASLQVKPGDMVSARQVLGSVGSSGSSTGPHLHFEVIRRGEPVNPREAAAE
jgi:murein DD-endopeptidase MepM/ murein hydrolase activator NlpD